MRANHLFYLNILWINLFFFLFYQGYAQEKHKSFEKNSVPVVAQPIQFKQSSRTEKFLGELRPLNKAFLSVDEAGRVHQILKREGDFVQKGELLARMVNPTLEAQYNLAKISLEADKIRLEQARKLWKRTQVLAEKKLSSQEKVEEVQANYYLQKIAVESRYAEIRRFQTILRSFQVKAPLEGQIISASLDLGKWISRTTVLYEIVNYQNLELNIGVSGQYLGQVRVRRNVQINVPVPHQGLKKQLNGQITAVVQNIEATTGKFLVKIRVPNPKNLPLSGMLVQVVIPIDETITQVVVPRKAIIEKSNKNQITLPDQDRARLISVRVLRTLNTQAMIESESLQLGDSVVIPGQKE